MPGHIVVWSAFTDTLIGRFEFTFTVTSAQAELLQVPSALT